jgi:acyl carrier protein
MNNLLSEKHTKAVLDILVEHLGVPEAQLTPDARLQEDLGADSLEEVEIIMALEERFGLSIPEEMAERISTVGDLFEALEELLHTLEQPRS